MFLSFAVEPNLFSISNAKHEYDLNPEPFDREIINEYVLCYLKFFAKVPVLAIAEKITLSFGFAEDSIASWDGSSTEEPVQAIAVAIDFLKNCQQILKCSADLPTNNQTLTRSNSQRNLFFLKFLHGSSCDFLQTLFDSHTGSSQEPY